MGRLILVRHGQSIWNLENRFTGWIDVTLSKKGIEEAKKAGKKLKEYKIDIAFTSHLIRAQETLYEILRKNKYAKIYLRVHEEKKNYLYYNNINKEVIEEIENEVVKIFTSEALNERYYGDLQGLNKDDMKKKVGEEKVHIWRRSFDVPPPNGESLKDTIERVKPYFDSRIKPLILEGKTVIISAHGNSLRAVTKFLENISDEKIPNVEIPTGVPIIYDFNENFEIISKKEL